TGRMGVSRMQGAPKVARESNAPPAQTENPSSARVSARPSACRERKAKKSAASDRENPQIMASLYMERLPSSKSNGDPSPNPSTHALPRHSREHDESVDERKALPIRP